VTEELGPVVLECVEGYPFVRSPLRLLVFRRPPERGGIWVPVSGKVETTDVDLESALRRELREETGLVRLRQLLPLDWHVPFRAPNGETWRLHAYGVELDRTVSPTLSHEHDAFAWVEPEEAIRRLHYDDNRTAVRRLVRRLPGGSRNV